MTWDIQYSEESKQDLKAIIQYISYDLGEPGIAKNLTRTILSEIGKLDYMPMRYQLFDEEPWHSQGLRVFAVKNYLVFYYPMEENRTVYIVRILYGGRDIRNQLKETIPF